MSEENTPLLRSIDDKLGRILLALETRTVPKKPSKRSRMGRMVAEAQESLATTAEQFASHRVVELWAEICPDCPQPVTMDFERREIARHFFTRMQGEEGVRNVFLTVAGNDWLCGRPTGPRRMTRSAGIGLFGVIANLAEVIEGTAK